MSSVIGNLPYETDDEAERCSKAGLRNMVPMPAQWAPKKKGSVPKHEAFPVAIWPKPEPD
jgi:hypothetical protein